MSHWHLAIPTVLPVNPMRNLFGILLILSGYVLIFYRLMIKHHYETYNQIKESTLGTIFSFPPHRLLPQVARKYLLRYWISFAILLVCLLTVALLTDFSSWQR